ncbi:nucleoside triphosphate pyrophosphatase [Balneola vulgaris]|uniref:nucleoside triphosphate pyrophosphatase n=1 Tax=Balneola vulgaris TaxID=287535 RepID=UPI00035DCC93|nr:Maf family protein [Balneola vulgaris]
MRIILASQSPRRKVLLEQLGLPFEIHPSGIEELITSDVPETIVADLASQKALDVAKHFTNDYLILGADTIVVQDNKILGKPLTARDAKETLLRLSGETHSVFTGVALVHWDQTLNQTTCYTFVEETKVTFSSLLEEEIDAYIQTGSPMDKAGAYGIQDDWGAVFVEKIDGDFYNVVGLPLNRLYHELKAHYPEALSLLNIHL